MYTQYQLRQYPPSEIRSHVHTKLLERSILIYRILYKKEDVV